MTSKSTKIVLIFIAISVAALFFILWLVDYSTFTIPEFLPQVDLRIYGILIMVYFILAFIIMQKSIIRSNPQATVFELILASAITVFFSLLIYEAIRQLLILRGQYNNDIFTVFKSAAIPGIALTLISATIVIQIKKVKGIWAQLITVIMLVLFYLTKDYLRTLDW